MTVGQAICLHHAAQREFYFSCLTGVAIKTAEAYLPEWGFLWPCGTVVMDLHAVQDAGST
eukprot:6469087-Amphidinium_carterae.4